MKSPATTRSIALMLISLVLMASGGAVFGARKAEAQVGGIVLDPTNLVQNTISAITASKQLLNPIFWALSQAAIQSLTKSTVNWINSGFNGSPAYASDLSNTMQRLGDSYANQFIGEFQSSLAINSPFRDNIAQSVLSRYFISTSRDSFFLQNPYTLNQVSPNDTALIGGDITNGGGIPAFMSLVLNCQNNPICAEQAAQTELDRRVSNAQGQLTQELGWGNGFFSFRGDCSTSGNSVGGISVDSNNGSTGGITVGGDSSQNASGVDLSNTNDCFGQNIQTPGSVIASSLNKSLGLGADSLVQAKEFDEIVNALMAQLLNNVLGGGGLGGLSQGSSATGGRTYFNQTAPAGGASAGVSVVSSFVQVLDTQTQQLQTYLANWQSINNAALAAKAALSASTCVPNAQSIISAQVQPIISQAATAIGATPNALNAIDRIRSEALGAVSQTTAQQSNILNQASSEYQSLLASNTLPDTSDFTYAASQAQDTGSASPSSLLTQMNQLTTQARCGQ